MRRRGAGALRACAAGAVRVALYGTLLLVALAAGLHFFGLPAFAERRLLAELEARGLVARVDRVRLDLPDGIVARRVRLYAGRAASAPLAEARQVVLRLGLPDRRAGRGWLRGASARGIVLLAGAPAVPGLAPAGFADLDADLEFAPGEVRVRRLEARSGGFRFRAEGAVTVGGAGGGAGRLPDDWAVRLRAPAAQAARWAARALEDFEAAGEPLVLARFAWHPENPARNEFAVTAAGGAGRFRGLAVTDWRVRAGLHDGRWTLHEAALGLARGRLALSGEYRPEDDRVSARMDGDLPLRDWLCLPVPGGVARALDRLDARADRARISVGTAGAVSPAQWRERLEGRTEVGPGEVAGIPFERIAARFRVEGRAFFLEDIEADIGRGAGRGPARGAFETDLATGRFTARGEAAFDPTILLPLFTARQALVAGSVVFPGAPPRIRMEIAGAWDRDEELEARGRIEAEDFVFQGAAVRHAEAEFRARGETLRLWDVVIERPEGRLTGWLEQRFATQEAEFEVESTLHPHALARMISPFTHRLLQQFRFEGPVRVVGRGRATFEDRHEHDFRLTVEAERMGMRWILADRLAFDVDARGDRIALRNMRGEWHGGRGEGEMELELMPGRTPVRYHARVRLEGAELAGIMRDLADSDASAYSGRLSAEGRLEGAIGVGEGRRAVGEGRVAVRDGRLLQIPLFGALSRGLSRLYPGLGFAAQNEFTADLALAEGRIRTENAQLSGGTISLRARGYYDIEHRIEMVAQVRPLRAGPVAATLRFLTFPITRLFEFDVSGTPRDPHWEPRNLPRELFLRFD